MNTAVRWVSGTFVTGAVPCIGEWSDYFYLNLEDPWRRSDLGFDSGDWELDIVGTPTAWQQKDEDELEWSEQIGLVIPDWVARARSAGEPGTGI
jgi:hypothetical protein